MRITFKCRKIHSRKTFGLGNVGNRKVVINLAVMGGCLKDRGRSFNGTDIDAVDKNS